MKRLAYNLALGLGITAAAPLLAPRLARASTRPHALARLGLGRDWLPSSRAGGAIWLHALSVGEVQSALPLAKALRERFPGRPLAFSAGTAQGSRMAREALGDHPGHFLFTRPLDLPWAVPRLLDRLEPCLFCTVEGDIWPEWQWALARRGVPRLLVNGRISPRTFKSYRRFKPLALELMLGFDRLLMQTKTDHERLLKIGVPHDRLKVGGNLKFDSAPLKLSAEKRRALADEIGLAGRVVLAAGSTHPGEDEICLDALAALKSKHPGAALLLAPRDISRGEELSGMCMARGLSRARLSQGRPEPGKDVIILDQLGKLAFAYAVASTAFVGGSFAPIGGHNLLEPAAQSVPVCFGPHTHNFLEMAKSLEMSGGGVRLEKSGDLIKEWGRILAEPGDGLNMGAKAEAFCRAHRGAVSAAVDEMEELMSGMKNA